MSRVETERFEWVSKNALSERGRRTYGGLIRNALEKGGKTEIHLFNEARHSTDLSVNLEAYRQPRDGHWLADNTSSVQVSPFTAQKAVRFACFDGTAHWL